MVHKAMTQMYRKRRARLLRKARRAASTPTTITRPSTFFCGNIPVNSSPGSGKGFRAIQKIAIIRVNSGFIRGIPDQGSA
jgi:hypothetical protein